MSELKNNLYKLIDKYGLGHEKVIAASQELDAKIALEQRNILYNHNENRRG